jgi:hypothetical protein
MPGDCVPGFVREFARCSPGRLDARVFTSSAPCASVLESLDGIEVVR